MQNLNLQPLRKLLAIFPHPDDETAFTAGLISRVVKQGTIVKLLCLTNGEASSHRYGLTPEDDLGTTRQNELRKVKEILGVSEIEFGNFPDRQLVNLEHNLNSYLNQKIPAFSPDAVITFEPEGIYGHPDHIFTSKLITDIQAKSHNFDLIYATTDPNKWNRTDGEVSVALVGRGERPHTPNFVLDLTKDEQTKKLACFKAHESQFEFNDDFYRQWEARGLLTQEYFFLLRP